MARQYDEDANFNNRFVVETNVNGEIVDQQEFMKRQYKDSLNSVYMPPEGSGLPTVTRGQRSKVEPPQPRPKRTKKTTTDKEDAALKKAVKEDLSNRGL